MKKTYYQYAWIPLLVGFLISCENDNEAASETTEEYAEEIVGVINVDFENLSQDVTLVAEDAEGGRNASLEECGVASDTSFTKEYSGEVISYGYTLEYGYELSCSSIGIPESLDWLYSCDGIWNGVRFNIDGESTGSLVVTGLLANSDNYLFNGTISRTQELIQKYRDQKTLISQTVITLEDLTIAKSTQTVIGGTATFATTGVSSTGNSYSYSCVVVFNGDRTATLTFSDGSVYTLDLATNEFE